MITMRTTINEIKMAFGRGSRARQGSVAVHGHGATHGQGRPTVIDDPRSLTTHGQGWPTVNGDPRSRAIHEHAPLILDNERRNPMGDPRSTSGSTETTDVTIGRDPYTEFPPHYSN